MLTRISRRAAHLLPRALPGPRRRRRPGASRSRAASRTPSATRARRHPRLVRRHGRPGLGHQPRVGRPAPVRDDAPGAARRLHQLRRHHLRRRARSCRRSSSTTARVWKNVVTEAKSKVGGDARRLPRLYQYNLIDEHMRRFNAEVPQIVLWDDHEVRDNWYRGDPGREGPATPSRAWPRWPRARGRPSSSTTRCAPSRDDPRTDLPLDPVRPARSRSSRSTCGPTAAANTREPPAARSTPASGVPRCGAAALAEGRAAARSATWKVIASDLPLGLIVARRSRPISRRSPTATPARRSAASSRSPTSCAS